MPQVWESTQRKRLILAAAKIVSSTTTFLSHRARPPSDKVESILVIELWNIGDVILVMPFLAQLRAIFPAARITLVSPAFARELLAGTGLVDEFVSVDLTWRGKDNALEPIRPAWGELWRALRTLRRLRFDLGFSCRLHLREHIILRLANTRRRVGYAFGADKGLLTDAIPIVDPDQHKVVDWLSLLGPFGGPLPIEPPHLRVSQSEAEWAATYLTSNGVSESDVVVGIHPGASLPQKRWPIERFADVARAVTKCRGVRALAFVDPGGHGASLSKDANVLGAMVGLREMIALIEQCDLLVCNDSGPMHIAGALGIPVVAIFLSGVNRWFAPLGEAHEFVSGDSSPSATGYHGARIDEIPTTRVIEATMRLLQERLGA